MPVFENGTRIRVIKPAEYYSYDEATRPEGKLAEGTEGTIKVGAPFRGRVSIVTTDGLFAWVPHHCLEPVDVPASEVARDYFLQPVQSPENLRADDVHLLLDRLVSPYAEVRQNAAVALAHAYSGGLLTSFEPVRQAIVAGTVSFGPVAEVLLAQARRETIDSLLEHLKGAAAEVHDQALAEWKRLEK
jgi:hypothetical protein